MVDELGGPCWDRMFGGYSSPDGAVFDASARDGIENIAVNKAAAAISDPQTWIEESAALARQYACAPPVSTGTNGAVDRPVSCRPC